MNQNNFLQKIFPSSSGLSPEQKRTNNMNKFLDCFNNFNKQVHQKCIREPNNIKNSNRPFLSSEPIKKISNNSELIGQRMVEPLFRVDSLRADYEPKSVNNRSRYYNTLSPDKVEKEMKKVGLMQKKIQAFTTINNNIETLPVQFFRKNVSQRSEERHKNEVEPSQQRKKSLNLLANLNQIQEQKEEKKQPEIKPKSKIFNVTPNFKIKKNLQEIAEEERKNKLQLKKQISEEYAKPFNPPTNVTAASYIIYEPEFSQMKKRKSYFPVIEGIDSPLKKNRKFPHSHKVLASFNSRNSVEVASLTKIMTCIVALQICEKHQLDAKRQKICIGKFQSNIVGTSAQISEGQTYTLEDLYYGLMLPSGNDASIAIAVWGGRVLLKKETNSHVSKKKQFYLRYIEEMNATSRKLGMVKTNYANSHGLVNPDNKSCAYDIAILSEHAMNNAQFRKIVSCRVYETTITYDPQQPQRQASTKKLRQSIVEREAEDEIEEGVDKDLDSNDEDQVKEKESVAKKDVRWENTHRLLQQKPSEYLGIKTGITNMAGPCLASCVKETGGRYFIIVVLNCDRLSMRFRDTETLKKWIYQREGLVSPKKKVSPTKKKVEVVEQEVLQL